MANWRQLGNGPARLQNQLSESFNVGATTIARAWSYPFHINHQETVHAGVQPIVDGTHVIIPTLQGKLRAISAGVSGGALQWTADFDNAPLASTPASDGNNIYILDGFGRLSARKLSDGTIPTGWPKYVLVVKNGLPFRGSILLADSKILVGGTDGYFYARSLVDGSDIWSDNLGSSIEQSASWSNASGAPLVVVGAKDGHTYAWNSSTGAQVWDSGVADNAAAYNDFYPLIVGSRVIQRPLVRYPYWRSGDPSGLSTPLRGIEAAWSDASAQNTVLSNYASSPTNYRRSLYVYDLDTGTDDPTHQWIHHYWPNVINNMVAPPCIDASGYPILGVENQGSYAGAISGWGRLDPATRKAVDALTVVISSVPNLVGGNRDENMAVSACANGIFLLQIEEGNAQTTGFYRQTDNVIHTFGGPGNSELLIGTEGGSSNAGVLSGGVLYHNCLPHTLVCWKAT